MNYIKNYIKLIDKAKNRIISEHEYTEEHHLIPKSIFPFQIARNILNFVNIEKINTKENKVKLLSLNINLTKRRKFLKRES